jgi:hypothetical protein
MCHFPSRQVIASRHITINQENKQSSADNDLSSKSSLSVALLLSINIEIIYYP